ERSHLYELLQEFDTAMMVTRTPDGRMHARPMAGAQLEPDADAYFATGLDSRKVQQSEANPEVGLTCQGPKRFAGVRGRASVSSARGLGERPWEEPWEGSFREVGQAPTPASIGLDAEDGEYWDNRGPRGIRHAFEAAKAYAKGERPRTGTEQHGRAHV